MVEIEISSTSPLWVKNPDYFGYADSETAKVWIKLARQPIGTYEVSDEQWMVRAVIHEILHLYVNPEIAKIQNSSRVNYDNCYNELMIDLLAQWSTTPENLDVSASFTVATICLTINQKLFLYIPQSRVSYGQKLEKLLSNSV